MAQIYLSWACRELGEYDAALEWANKAVKSQNDFWSQKELALSRGAKGMWGEAEKGFQYFERWTQDKKDKSTFSGRLAWSLATHPNPALQNGPWAVELAEFAVANSERKDDLSLEALAVALARVGEYNKAVSAVEEAIRINDCEDYQEELRLFRQRKPFDRKSITQVFSELP